MNKNEEASQLEKTIVNKLQKLLEDPEWEINQLLRKRNKLAVEIGESKINVNDIFSFIEFGFNEDGGEISLPI